MSKTKQGLRKTTLLLVEEAEENYVFYGDEVQKAINEQSALKEKGKILELALMNAKSNGAHAIIQTLLSQVSERITEEEQRQSESERKRKYYSEVKRALSEAIKDFKEI